MVRTGSWLVVGGYRYEASKGITGVLEYLDARTGRHLRDWDANALMPGQSSFAAPFETESGQTLLPLVEFGEGESQREGTAIAFLAIGGGVPKSVTRFETSAKVDARSLRVFARDGGYLLAYSDAWHASAPIRSGNFDDYDMKACFAQPITRLETRDRNGVLQQSREINGFVLETATRTHEGDIFLGGKSGECSDDVHAAAFQLDDQLGLTSWYADSSVGTSRVRSIARSPGGKLLLAIQHDIVVDLDRPTVASAAMNQAPRMDSYVAGRVLALGAPNTIEASVSLDAGSDVFLSSIDASDPGDILVGGGVGDEAVLFHFALDPVGLDRSLLTPSPRERGDP
jgi:hypothetical protein